MCSHILLRNGLRPGYSRPSGKGFATAKYSAHQPDIEGACRQTFLVSSTDICSHGLPQEQPHDGLQSAAPWLHWGLGSGLASHDNILPECHTTSHINLTSEAPGKL